MKTKTIRDAYKAIKETPNTNFLSCLSSPLFNGHAWATEYKQHFTSCDPLAVSLFGDLIIDDIIIDENGEIDLLLLKEYMTAEMLANSYMYDKMWDAMLLEYEPLWNVDGVEIITYSEKQTTHEVGARKETSVIGARNETFDSSIRKNTTTHGDDSTTNQLSADNSNTFVNSDKTMMTTGDTISTDDATTDTRVTNPATDTRSNDKATDKDTEGTHTETHERRGNIGVTSSQKLLLETFDVAKINFYKMILRDACASISIPIML